MKSVFFLLLGLLPIFTSANAPAQQERKISTLFHQLINSTDSVLTIKNVKWINDLNLQKTFEYEAEYRKYFAAQTGLPIDSATDFVNLPIKDLYLENVQAHTLDLSYLHFNKVHITNSRFTNLNLISLSADSLILQENKIEQMFAVQGSEIGLYLDQENQYGLYEVEDCRFNRHFQLTGAAIGTSMSIAFSVLKEGAIIAAKMKDEASLYLVENQFEAIDVPLVYQNDSLLPEPTVFLTQLALQLWGEAGEVYITANEFFADNPAQMIYLYGQYPYVNVTENVFEGVFFPILSVSGKLNLSNNQFDGRVNFTELILEGQNNIIDWPDLAGMKLITGKYFPYDILVWPELFGHSIAQRDSIYNQTSEIYYQHIDLNENFDFASKQDFRNLTSSYYRLFQKLKANGQISLANDVYVEMKDFELTDMQHNYKEHSSLENLIKIQLHKMHRFYTDYGTNPAKAITISIFILGVFAIIYFFFPSEWDAKSKRQIYNEYRNLVENNEKGYLRPILGLVGGFTMSLLNAFTLSLNSFVTLGFGSIPTTGVARYICIIEGFLGWFLLSIFTASLINQVMF